MKLADLRKLSIRRQIRIRFPLRNGMECVVNEHGIAQVPGLRSVPDFNLEQELVSAASFVLEPVAASAAALFSVALVLGRLSVLASQQQPIPGLVVVVEVITVL